MFLTALAIVLADDTQTGSDAREVAGILLRGCVVGRVRTTQSRSFLAIEVPHCQMPPFTPPVRISR